MAEKPTYPPLGKKEYAETFATFIANSTEYDEMPLLAKPVIEGFNGKKVKMLSIGAGTGCLETVFINDIGLNLSFYYAIEPASEHRSKLEESIKSWGDVAHEINPCCFTPSFSTEHRFEFVMVSHSLYCMSEWRENLAAIYTLLAPGGKFILFHHHTTTENYLMVELLKHAIINPPPVQDHTLTTHMIKDELEARNIKSSMTIGPSKMKIDDFVVGRHEEEGATHVVDFLLQCSYKNLSVQLKDAIKKIVDILSEKNQNGLYEMSHPTAMLLVEK